MTKKKPMCPWLPKVPTFSNHGDIVSLADLYLTAYANQHGTTCQEMSPGGVLRAKIEDVLDYLGKACGYKLLEITDANEDNEGRTFFLVHDRGYAVICPSASTPVRVHSLIRNTSRCCRAS